MEGLLNQPNNIHEARMIIEEQQRRQNALLQLHQKQQGIDFNNYTDRNLNAVQFMQQGRQIMMPPQQQQPANPNQDPTMPLSPFNQNNPNRSLLPSQRFIPHPAAVTSNASIDAVGSIVGGSSLLHNPSNLPNPMDAIVQNECRNIMALQSELKRQQRQKQVADELELVNKLTNQQTVMLELEKRKAAEELLSQFVELDKLVARQEVLHHLANEMRGTVPDNNLNSFTSDFTNDNVAAAAAFEAAFGAAANSNINNNNSALRAEAKLFSTRPNNSNNNQDQLNMNLAMLSQTMANVNASDELLGYQKTLSRVGATGMSTNDDHALSPTFSRDIDLMHQRINNNGTGNKIGPSSSHSSNIHTQLPLPPSIITSSSRKETSPSIHSSSRVRHSKPQLQPKPANTNKNFITTDTALSDYTAAKRVVPPKKKKRISIMGSASSSLPSSSLPPQKSGVSITGSASSLGRTGSFNRAIPHTVTSNTIVKSDLPSIRYFNSGAEIHQNGGVLFKEDKLKKRKSSREQRECSSTSSRSRQKHQKKLPTRSSAVSIHTSNSKIIKQQSIKKLKKVATDVDDDDNSVSIRNKDSKHAKSRGPHHDLMLEFFPRQKKGTKKEDEGQEKKEDKMSAVSALLGFKTQS